MTVPSTYEPVQSNGNSVTTLFPFPYVFFDDTDLLVTLTLISTGANTTQVLNTDYTVTGGDGDDGSITFAVAPPTGYRVTIELALPYTQEDDYVENQAFPAETLESGLDKAAIRDQQLLASVERSLKFPNTLSGSLVGILPAPEDGRALIWDGVTGTVENGPDAADIAGAQQNAEDAIAAKDAAEAAQVAAEAAAALLPLNKYDGTAAPTINDDSGDGYSVGSKWYDLTNDEAYICLDATLGAAVWVITTLDTEDLGTAAFVDVIDEDSMATDSATRPPSQQSTKAYVDNSITNFGVKLQTLVSVTSGTSVTLSSSIPAGVKRVIVNCDNISFTGSESLQLDLNSEVTGYVSGSSVFSGTTAYALYTNAFRMRMATAAANGTYARFTLTLVDASTNKWYCEATGTNTVDSTCIITGLKALSGALTTLRLNGAGGGTFDGTGSASISWEF